MLLQVNKYIGNVNRIKELINIKYNNILSSLHYVSTFKDLILTKYLSLIPLLLLLLLLLPIHIDTLSESKALF